MLRHYNHYMKYDNSNMYKVMFIGKKDSLHDSIDTIATPIWIIDSTEIFFLKHRCREAYTIAPSLDTIFILFAVYIPLPFGPFNFFAAPGLVFEPYNTEKDFYIIAKYTEQSVYQMMLPSRN
jgi:GLPGLI family protein